MKKTLLILSALIAALTMSGCSQENMPVLAGSEETGSVTAQVTEAETEPDISEETAQTTEETSTAATTTVPETSAPVTTTAAPVTTTTAAPITTTTAAPVTTTTAAPVTTTPAPPVTTTTVITTTEAVTEAPAQLSGLYGQRAQTAEEIEFCNRVFDLTNVEREKAGLSKFKKMSEITDMAVLRAWECTVSYSHTRPDGTRYLTALNGLSFGHVGENIAAGYTTAEAVVDGWMNSPTHRANILNPDFEYLGVGCYYVSSDTYGYYWAQNFYTPLY